MYSGSSIPIKQFNSMQKVNINFLNSLVTTWGPSDNDLPKRTSKDPQKNKSFFPSRRAQRLPWQFLFGEEGAQEATRGHSSLGTRKAMAFYETWATKEHYHILPYYCCLSILGDHLCIIRWQRREGKDRTTHNFHLLLGLPYSSLSQYACIKK